MRFANPWLFLLAVPVGAAALHAWRGSESRRAALSFPGVRDLLGLASAAQARAVRGAPLALKTAVLLLVVAALARPQSVSRQAAGLTQGIDILLVMDTSTSMQALDFDPLDRMTASKNAAREFISKRIADRIGIVVFGGDPVLACPLTLDYEALQGFLDQITPGMTKSEGTAIGDGIVSGLNHLKESLAKSKVIILLTDGANNAGLVDPLTAAKAARSSGIKVYTIGTAQRGDALVPVDDPRFGRRLVKIPDELDEDLLTKIAYETGGKYFRATNLKELSQIYAEIDRMEKTDLKLPDVVSFKDVYRAALIPAALLLALELGLSATWLLRVP